MNRKRFSIFLGFMFVALIAITSVISANNLDQKFTVSREGQEIAKLTISTDKRFVKAIVEKQGQPAHSYVKSALTGDVTISIGDKKVFVYNNKSGDFKAPTLNSLGEGKTGNVKQLKWTENRFSEMSVAIQNLLAEDMKVFRAVRNFDNSAQTRSFELAYVILTADESIYWMSDFSEYKVTSSKSKNKETFQKISFDDPGCGTACDSRLAACLRDVQPDQRIECYRIADGCHARCNPQPVGTPEA